jgi:hypothetical protein
MRYKDQLKDARKWAYIEAGYNEELSADEKLAAKNKADELFEEAAAELQLIEEEEENNYNKYERRYKRGFDAA